MAKMRAVQVTQAKGPFELIEREIPEPGPGEVRIKVHACGVCHSDSITKEGILPGINYPRIPGHEVAGVLDTIGEGVKGWTPGQRVGVGWQGGHCGYCNSCRRGDFITCQIDPKYSGISYDGGYAEYMVAPASVLALIPDGLSFIDAGPLMCAGITTYNSLRHSGALPGDLVAVLGVGGLGHLAVQFAAKMGFKTIAIARGKEKEPLAKKLGATQYINSQEQNVAETLKKMGGAKIILATVTDSKAISDALGGLGVNGKMMIVGASMEPLQISMLPLIFARQSIMGWPSGTSIDSQDTMDFSLLTGVRSMNEIFPLERAADAYERMMSGKAKFRVILTME